MKKRGIIGLLLVTMVLLVGCQAMAKEEPEKDVAQYYYIPEVCIYPTYEKVDFSTISDDIICKSDTFSTRVSSVYGYAGVFIFQMDNLDGIESASLAVFDQILPGKIDKEEGTIGFVHEDFDKISEQDKKSYSAQLSLNETETTVPIVAVEPLSSVENLGTVIRDNGIAMVIVPDQEKKGVVISPLNEEEAGLDQVVTPFVVTAYDQNGEAYVLNKRSRGCYYEFPQEIAGEVVSIVIDNVEIHYDEVFMKRLNQDITLNIPLAGEKVNAVIEGEKQFIGSFAIVANSIRYRSEGGVSIGFQAPIENDQRYLSSFNVDTVDGGQSLLGRLTDEQNEVILTIDEKNVPKDSDVLNLKVINYDVVQECQFVYEYQK